MKTSFPVPRRTLLLLLAIAPLGNAANAADPKQVVTFAAASFAEPARGEKMRAWIAKFNQSQEKVEIQPVTIPFSSFVSTIFTQMGGNAGPDLVRFDLPEFYAAADAKRIAPMDEYIKDGDFKFSSPDKYMKIAGKRYGVVFEVSNYSMVYNTALVKKAPANFDEFLASAKTATANGNFGYAYRATMAERGGFWYDLTNYVYGFGGRWSDAKGNPTLNSPKVIEGVVAYKKVYDAGVIPRGADASTYRRMFAEGKIGMQIDNGGVAANLASQGKEMQMAAAPSPFPTRAQGMILAPITINANSKNKAAAAVFLKWMLTPEAQRELQQIHGASSVAVAVQRSPEEIAKWPWIQVYDDQTENSVPALPQGLETKAPEIQQIVIEQVIKVLQGGVDPTKAMNDAQNIVLSRVLKR
ncbi:MAG: extracellular solute-binding protein [Polaromonas sp.]|uniref:ABC transporter substrate-binding protein n=1 Tax=Polaromonas sp. TaxID=1869339 RepID=UPI0024873544|nr:extracellular solute-binding protein [Polaromonas sp.]MDI1270512.1 extracellular solute-binding protein [Polaromonas sp.]